MGRSKTSFARLNIYVRDPAVRRQVKAAAAKRDLSVTEYCLRAIARQLVQDGEQPPEGKPAHLKGAVGRAREFQARAFQGQTFSINSAELIAEAREERARTQ